MHNRNLIVLFVVLGLVPAPAFPEDLCPPSGYGLPDLLQIRQAGFEIDSDEKRNALAITLLACLADPDPRIRDGVAYEGLATWLRGGNLSANTIDALYSKLLMQIAGEEDSKGYQQPFAALVLSEVARTDRIDGSFSASRRDELVTVAANYLSMVRDYRGFSAAGGWRHGVAHGSDLALQLVLNPNINAEQIRSLLAALASQVAPAGEVFYHYGEPERLARAAFYAWRRGVVEDPVWLKWFETISSPHPLENWEAAFSSQAGLAKRHNTLAFLLALHLNASATAEEQDALLDQWVLQAVKRVK